MKDALGHGSNAHTSGIAKIGNIQLHPGVLAAIRQNPGGFSVRPTTGQMPNNGFMVSMPGHTKIVNESELSGPHGPQVISEYVKEHATALQEKGAHIGGWTDSAIHKTYLDVSHNIRNKNSAIYAGKARNQIAIWDVKHGREIRTGGTGE